MEDGLLPLLSLARKPAFGSRVLAAVQRLGGCGGTVGLEPHHSSTAPSSGRIKHAAGAKGGIRRPRRSGAVGVATARRSISAASAAASRWCCVLTGGERHEQPVLPTLMERGAVKRPGRGRPRVRPERVAGDKGYSSPAVRRYLKERRYRGGHPDQGRRSAGPGLRPSGLPGAQRRRAAHQPPQTVTADRHALREASGQLHCDADPRLHPALAVKCRRTPRRGRVRISVSCYGGWSFRPERLSRRARPDMLPSHRHSCVVQRAAGGPAMFRGSLATALLALVVLFVPPALAAAQDATPTAVNPPTPPGQPMTGPGGAEYPFTSVRVISLGDEAGGGRLFEPTTDTADGTPGATKSLPLVLLLDGCCYRPERRTVSPALAASVARGSRRGSSIWCAWVQSWSIRSTVALSARGHRDRDAGGARRVASGDHAQPDTDHMAVIGFSFSGWVAADYMQSRRRTPGPELVYGPAWVDPVPTGAPPLETHALVLVGENDVGTLMALSRSGGLGRCRQSNEIS